MRTSSRACVTAGALSAALVAGGPGAFADSTNTTGVTPSPVTRTVQSDDVQSPDGFAAEDPDEFTVGDLWGEDVEDVEGLWDEDLAVEDLWDEDDLWDQEDEDLWSEDLSDEIGPDLVPEVPDLPDGGGLIPDLAGLADFSDSTDGMFEEIP
ncbi:hypothetical protein [Streptomyces sp. NPDC002845]